MGLRPFSFQVIYHSSAFCSKSSTNFHLNTNVLYFSSIKISLKLPDLINNLLVFNCKLFIDCQTNCLMSNFVSTHKLFSMKLFSLNISGSIHRWATTLLDITLLNTDSGHRSLWRLLLNKTFQHRYIVAIRLVVNTSPHFTEPVLPSAGWRAVSGSFYAKEYTLRRPYTGTESIPNSIGSFLVSLIYSIRHRTNG